MREPEWRMINLCTNGLHIANIYQRVYGSGHETVAVLLPGFAINW